MNLGKPLLQFLFYLYIKSKGILIKFWEMKFRYKLLIIFILLLLFNDLRDWLLIKLYTVMVFFQQK